MTETIEQVGANTTKIAIVKKNATKLNPNKISKNEKQMSLTLKKTVLYNINYQMQKPLL